GFLKAGTKRPRRHRAAEQGYELTPPHATPRPTRMPEYQMADPSAKANAAQQSAGARDVSCGLDSAAPFDGGWLNPRFPTRAGGRFGSQDPRAYSLRVNPSLSIAARSSAASLGTNLA